jgi:hypothetical protein
LLRSVRLTSLTPLPRLGHGVQKQQSARAQDRLRLMGATFRIVAL